MGLDVYIENADTDAKSTLYPSNICTPTYLRSSYNEGGFNSAVPRFLKDENTTLYHIFEPILGSEDEEYEHRVTDPGKVMLVQDRARDVARRLRALTNPLTTISVRTLGGTGFSEIDAINWAEAELAKETKWGAYQCRDGYIDPEGTTVVGATLGRRGEMLLVVRAVDADGLPWSRHYAESAEIVAEEFCQTLLDLIESDGAAIMGWSA